ncbi:hypothetical protein LXL04_025421 [Taraxacum kok-saghyz]
MPPKGSSPLDDPPSASSDDEETEDEQEQHQFTQKPSVESSSEEDEVEDESEEEIFHAVKNPLEKPTIQNPNSKPADSSSEEESESDSEEEIPTPVKPQTLPNKSSSTFDSDSDLRSPTASDFVIKPSKKINALPTPEKTPLSKRRLSSEPDAKDKKKIKLPNGDADDGKMSVIKRVWSDDDEILLLQGFIDYQSKKGCSPLSDMDAFYQFTMDSLPGNASKSQLYEKIRRLKKKFRVNFEKASINGVDPVFPKPHERKLFDVSNKIWGIDGCETLSAAAGGSNLKPKVKTPKPKPKIEAKEDDEVAEVIPAKVEDFETLYPYWNAGLNTECSSSFKFPTGVVDLIKENFSSIGEAKAQELNQKWKTYFENEAMLRRRRIALLSSVIDLGTDHI